MEGNVNLGKCPRCGAKEVQAMTPRTTYSCGSSDYDQRPGTFTQSELCLLTDLENVVHKHFEDGKVKYFMSSDAHKNIEGDTYLTYKKYGKDRVELYIGGDNGEMCIAVTGNPVKLDLLISNIIR